MSARLPRHARRVFFFVALWSVGTPTPMMAHAPDVMLQPRTLAPLFALQPEPNPTPHASRLKPPTSQTRSTGSDRRMVVSTGTGQFVSAAPPRYGWSFLPGAEDLIHAWGCVSSVAAGGTELAITAGDTYNTIINTNGPTLRVDGDFSVIATMSALPDAQTYLTLVGTLNTGEWWNGLKRLDVGIAGRTVAVSYWTGSSSTPSSKSFSAPANLLRPFNLEVAHVGYEIVVFINGAESGRFPDQGIFDSGEAYLGFNVAPHATLSVKALAVSVPSDSLSSASLVSPYIRKAPRSGVALRDKADPRGFLIGAAVSPTLLSHGPYADTLGREFNVAVAENAMKFAALHPAEARYDFCAADNLVTYAQTNGMAIRGHTLVWHESLPDWLTKGHYAPAEVEHILHDHINTAVNHFKGKLLSWDVVNEAISYSPPYGPQPSFWLDSLGPNYLDLAFTWAREADPDVKLFYNETGGEGLGAKSDAVYNLAKGMLNRGVPIDGIGLQMHLDVAKAPRFADISANIRRLGQLGLEVHITEMDVRLPVPATAANLAAQAAIYQDVVSACRANANCKALLTWGVSDANSWIPGFYPGYGSALLFDEQYRAKQAYQSVSTTIGS